MNTQKLVALSLAVLVVIWMVFPRTSTSFDTRSEIDSESLVTAISDGQPYVSETTGFTVRAARLSAKDFTEYVRVRGRTEAFRTVDVKAEQAGRVIATPIAEGTRVNQGEVLCEIAVDTRASDLHEAESRRHQTKVEYDAVLDLQKQGLTSAVSVAQAKAAFDAAVAAVARTQLALENTRIKAPFAGVVEARPAEIGALLERGHVCATLLDDDPMLLVGLVPEQQIGKLKVGASVSAELLTGETINAMVTYLSHSAEAVSRSYRIEARIEQNSGTVLDGITAEMFIAAAEIQAHLIPASALTLSDSGNVGVKTLNNKGIVAFNPVSIVGDEPAQVDSGVWITGLASEVTLITHGQEIVFAGQQVNTDFSWSTTDRFTGE